MQCQYWGAAGVMLVVPARLWCNELQNTCVAFKFALRMAGSQQWVYESMNTSDLTSERVLEPSASIKSISIFPNCQLLSKWIL